MRILVGASGGLDSTYTMKLLLEQGHEVTGACLVMSEHTDVDAARGSCLALGVPFVELDVRADFERYVVSDFVGEYSRARTPNPCVACNRFVKIGALCAYARDNGFDRVATGHYCDIKNRDGRFFVSCAADCAKDQSYVLWQLTQEQLSMLETPLADKHKADIRAESRSAGLAAADRGESQDICFIPDGDYISFIEKRTGAFPTGNFISPQGDVLGRHRGIVHYTIGQRKGLGIALGEPVFVVAIDAGLNTVTLAPAGGEFGCEFAVSSLNFQKLFPGDGIYDGLNVKIRYAAKPVSCSVEIREGTAHVKTDAPVRAVTPGQSAVFYDNEGILFGGKIQ